MLSPERTAGLEALKRIDPRSFWSKKGQGEDISPRSPLSGWFTTTEFRAAKLAHDFPQFGAIVGSEGELTDFPFDVIVPREQAANLPLALAQADILLTTTHGWAARKEVMGIFPYLIMVFSRYRVVGFNTALPGFGPAGFKESVPDSQRTPKGINATLLKALATIGIEEPPSGKVAIHSAHSLGPITFLSDRYPRLRDPRYGHILFNPAFAEVDEFHRWISYLGLGHASRLLAIPGAKRAFAALAAETVTRIWGGPHTTPTIKRSHRQTVRETSPRTIAYSLLALADERPLEAARLNGKLNGANVLAFIADDGFTPLGPAYEGLINAGLELEKIVQLPEAGHYSFGLETPQPPKDTPPTQEGLRAWILEEAQINPDVARVVGIAQQTAEFMDLTLERYQASL